MTDLNDRMRAELDRDRDELLAEIDRLKAEVERLGAGAEDPYALPGVEPTPGQWIGRFLAASAHGRRDLASQALENGMRAARCYEAAHEANLKQADAWQQCLLASTATVAELPDRQLHIEWCDGARDPWDWTLIRPGHLDALVHQHNALVRELATVTTGTPQ